MAYAYEKLITDNELNLKDLPDSVQVAIDSIKDAEKGVNMLRKKAEKKGEAFEISDKVKRKVKLLDQWAVSGISEYLEGRPVTTPAPTVTGEQIVAEVKAENTVVTEEPVVNTDGQEIDLELQALLASGTTDLSPEQLKSKAPKAYAIVFDSYKDGEENGLETSNFRLLETEKELFVLTKI